MVLLDLALLPRSPRIAVEEAADPLARPAVELDGRRVGELASVVREDARERPPVQLDADLPLDPFERPRHLGGGLLPQQEGQHEVRFPEQERQQAGGRPPARQHRVHLDDLNAGVLRDEGDEVVVGPPGEAGEVGGLVPGLPVPLRVPDPFGQVDVGQARYQPKAYELQHRRVRPPDLGPVRLEYLGQRLVLPLDERDQQRGEPGELRRVGVAAGPR